MRSFFSFFLLLALITFTGCAVTAPTASDTLCVLLSGTGKTPPAYEMYIPHGQLQLSEISERLYGKEDISALLADYAVLLARGTELYEVHVLQVKNPADLPVVQKQLQKRADAIRLAVEEGHTTDPYAIVAVHKNTVFLFATPYNNLLLSCLEKL